MALHHVEGGAILPQLTVYVVETFQQESQSGKRGGEEEVEGGGGGGGRGRPLLKEL